MQQHAHGVPGSNKVLWMSANIIILAFLSWLDAIIDSIQSTEKGHRDLCTWGQNQEKSIRITSDITCGGPVYTLVFCFIAFNQSCLAFACHFLLMSLTTSYSSLLSLWRSSNGFRWQCAYSKKQHAQFCVVERHIWRYSMLNECNAEWIKGACFLIRWLPNILWVIFAQRLYTALPDLRVPSLRYLLTLAEQAILVSC